MHRVDSIFGSTSGKPERLNQTPPGPSKSSLKKKLIIAVVTGFALSVALIFYFILNHSFQSRALPLIVNTATIYKPEEVKQEKINSGLPVRLKIPKINVNAALEHVGITSGGALDVPSVLTSAAWFDLGPRPGEKGSSVIDGHFGWEHGKPAVFNNLYKLRSGDKLYVEDGTGATITFVVRESRNYDSKADATGVFSSNDGIAHLNLITCEGVWDKVSKSYSKRLVVFADKE